MFSRLTWLKPVRVKVSEYTPGSRFTIRYTPAPSVTAERTFSINAGLAASTVTPGSTALEASRTVPVKARDSDEGASQQSNVMSVIPIGNFELDLRCGYSPQV